MVLVLVVGALLAKGQASAGGTHTHSPARRGVNAGTRGRERSGWCDAINGVLDGGRTVTDRTVWAPPRRSGGWERAQDRGSGYMCRRTMVDTDR